MEGFTIVDGIVLALIAISGVRAYARGLVRESLSIDDSHSVEIFAGLEQRIAAMLPEDAPQWIASQYARLTQTCTA